jgi:outer membrane cobalamin receptor
MKTASSKIFLLSFCLILSFFGIILKAQKMDSIKKVEQITIQDTTKHSLTDLSLKELSQIKVSVASKTAVSMKESPGIVTLITKSEIAQTGARDLIDVLRLVPGFEFGIDVRGVTSIGIRGNWAHEGKVLLLWDGQVLNEQLFPSIQIGNHYPVDIIERIEIIRGPGSAIYGGDAELGVINIITSPASELTGTQVNTSFGWMEKSYARRNVSIAVGDKKEGYEIDFAFYAGKANRSDQIMTDYHIDNPYHSYEMADQSTMEPFFLNIGFTYKNLKSRLIIDNYNIYDRTMYGFNLATPLKIGFHSYIADLQYEYIINNGLKIIPRINYTKNLPWQCLDKRYSPPVYLDKWAERFSAGITMDQKINPNLNVISGLDFFDDIGHAGDSTYFLRNTSKKKLQYNNFSIFTQCLYFNDIANITVGARFERNSETGNSFVPRFAVTKVLDGLHLKFLYSFAFRAPGIENISRYSSKSIQPEKTNVIEFEAGYDLSDNMFITANAYNIIIKDPIVFMLDQELHLPAYQNGSRSGTSGIEAVYHYKSRIFESVLTYSFYKSYKNEIFDYKVQSDEDILLGFPQHKFTLNSTIHLMDKMTFNLSGTYLSKRYIDNNESKTQYIDDPKLLLNFFINYSELLNDNLSIGFGIYNLLDVQYSFIQPYIGGSAPLPGPSREYLIKILYSM